MDEKSKQVLMQLLQTQRTGALGTLRDGAPFVSLLTIAPAAEMGAFYIHVSRLAFHTQDILRDPRVSLMLAEPDLGTDDPLQLARLSIIGSAHEIAHDSPEFQNAAATYLARFPDARVNFQLADFSLFRIEPQRARFVAGFGKIFNLDRSDLFALNT